MNCQISLNKANKNWYNNGKKYGPTYGHVKIDDAAVIAGLETDGGNLRQFSATVELSPGPHTLKISCTRGWGMSIDNVKVLCTHSAHQPEQQRKQTVQFPVQRQAVAQNAPMSPDNPSAWLLDGLKKQLDGNLAELKELRDKNPACYLNPSDTSIINVAKKIASMKDRRYCTCNNVTFVRDAFYCSNCKQVTGYREGRDYDSGSRCCKVSRKQSFYRWLVERKKVDETMRINARIDELYKKNEPLEEQIRSIERSRPKKR